MPDSRNPFATYKDARQTDTSPPPGRMKLSHLHAGNMKPYKNLFIKKLVFPTSGKWY